MKPNRQATVRKFRLGEEHCERQCRLTRTPKKRVMEVFRLRAIWGADHTPMLRQVTSIHRLGEKGRRGP